MRWVLLVLVAAALLPGQPAEFTVYGVRPGQTLAEAEEHLAGIQHRVNGVPVRAGAYWTEPNQLELLVDRQKRVVAVLGYGELRTIAEYPKRLGPPQFKNEFMEGWSSGVSVSPMRTSCYLVYTDGAHPAVQEFLRGNLKQHQLRSALDPQ